MLYFSWRIFLALRLLGDYSWKILFFSYKKIWVHIDNGVRGTFEAFLLLIVVFVSQKEFSRPLLKYLILLFFALVFVYDFFLSALYPFFRAGFNIFN